MALALGCRSAPPQLPPERVVGKVETYRIGVPDLLRVHVWKQDEISSDVVVRPDGQISLPLVQDVQAEGLTPEELKEVITEELSEFISAPDVTVVVSQMNSQQASILGGIA